VTVEKCLETCVVRIHVGVLGPAKLEVDGAEVRLTPRTTRLLVRLVAAGGEAVSVRQLYQDVWDVPCDKPHQIQSRQTQPRQTQLRQTQRSRNEVQKRILEIRQAMNHRRSGEAAGILRTEQIFTGREPESAYRLVLECDQLDCIEFTELVNHAMRAAPASAAAMLTRALTLWRGKPLVEVGDAGFSRPVVRRLTGLYETARSELVQIHTESGHLELALPIAEKMAEEWPDDPAAPNV
jgi:Bacterial transcriptional activator domain